MTPLPPAFDGSWLVAHRGSHDIHRENSLAALERAARLGLPAEFDVRVTRHDEIIVFHDDTLDRLTTERGAVAELSPARRRALDIPTLTDALDAHRGALLIELKRSPRDDAGALVRGVSDIARHSHGLAERSILMSFDPTLLRDVHAQLPRFMLARLIGGRGRVVYESVRRALRADPHPETPAVGPAAPLITRRAVGRWHGRGVRVFSWTAKSARDVRRAARLNVDLCIADPFSGYEHFREGPHGQAHPRL